MVSYVIDVIPILALTRGILSTSVSILFCMLDTRILYVVDRLASIVTKRMVMICDMVTERDDLVVSVIIITLLFPDMVVPTTTNISVDVVLGVRVAGMDISLDKAILELSIQNVRLFKEHVSGCNDSCHDDVSSL